MALYFLGIDIGGSHLSGAVVQSSDMSLVNGSYTSIPVTSSLAAGDFVDNLDLLIRTIIQNSKVTVGELSAIGIAIPGPFDYQRGISKIYGVQKYDSLFGFNITAALNKIIGCPVYFINDAESFAIGEYYAGAAKDSAKSIIFTLGTGFGSTFLDDGIVQKDKADGVPENGYLYNVAFKNGIADDYFSTRWFVQQWKELGRENVTSVKEIASLAENQDPDALSLFAIFADNFIDFISPWIQSYKPQRLVFGGGIAEAAHLFKDRITSSFSKFPNLEVSICQLWDKAAIIGAAHYAYEKSKNTTQQDLTFRKTEQFLAPVKRDRSDENNYEAYPSFPIGDGKIQLGAAALAQWISAHKRVVIDGYIGVFWHTVVESLDAELLKLGIKARWFHTEAAMKTEEELKTMLEPYLGGDDPLFGKITDKHLSDWFDREKLYHIQPDPSADVNILIGPGAALGNWNAPLVYFDLPKNELQFRARAGKANNLGVTTINDSRRTYKRFFFIDWVVLNRHKKEILPDIAIMVDEQRPDNYLFMTGNDLRDGLSSMAKNVFRARPWFEPGAWGGSWMMHHLEGINKDVSNLAWSFELMVLENGLLLESDGYQLEVSFDTLMFNSYQDILGDCAEIFKYDFPIRFDFLDTFDGGNLSIQCHPSPKYIKEHFGMPFTQDETYYILDCKEDPVVYLGFQEGVEPKEFHDALVYSQEHVEELDVEKYIQKFTAKKHDLFLIPNGTIHASGSNNMVLEISAAPYIFTFKMYDWLRLDLDGKPRPINIERGMENLNFSRSGDKVVTELISVPSLLTENRDYSLEHLPTHAEHFYDIHRYSINTNVQVQTDNKCHVWMVVEGQSVRVETEGGVSQVYNYAETFVIPAAAGSYTIYNDRFDTTVKLVMSFVKSGVTI